MKSTLDKCDILIKGGRIIDGTGAPSFKADIAINGEYIFQIGALIVEILLYFVIWSFFR